jgi:hypothetical protein
LPAARSGISRPASSERPRLLCPPSSASSGSAEPEELREAQIARALSEGKITPAQIEAELARAADEGQGVYTVADAMGNSGQRMLSTVTRSPGQARTDVVAALDSRQGDQGRRLSGALREGFDAPQTAEQTRGRPWRRGRAAKQTQLCAGKGRDAAMMSASRLQWRTGLSRRRQIILPLGTGRVPTDLAARAGIEGAESALRDPIASL